MTRRPIGATWIRSSCANRKIESPGGLDSRTIDASGGHPPPVRTTATGGSDICRYTATLSAYQLRERMSVFAAYRLPGIAGQRSIGDSITPVNALRTVLRHYFGADLPPVEDASYWGLESKPLELVRIQW